MNTYVLQKLLKFCAFQERSESEVTLKIRAFSLNEEENNEIFQFLLEEKYVDNKRYMETFIRSKLNQKGWGKTKIRYELLKKQIPAALIDQYLGEVEEIYYNEIIENQIDKWLKLNPKSDGKSDRYQKLFRYLYSKGFENELISRKLNKRKKEI